MPDPSKSSIWEALIPLLGGAAAAYSPRYLGTGVAAGANLYGAMQDRKYQAQRATIEQAYRDQMLQEQKDQTEQARIHNELAGQTSDEKGTARKKAALAFRAQYGPTDPNMSMAPDPKVASIADALESGGITWEQANERMQPPPTPKPAAESAPDYPFAAGGGGTYDKRTGKWSERPAGRPAAAGGKPTSVEGQIIQLDREIRQIGEALKFADPDEEGELQAQLEDAKAARDQLKSQRTTPPGGGSNPNPTVQVNIPGVHTDAGKRLAAKYLGK
jgi:hypothetical protein